jgi:hypothetical protein
MLNTSFDLLASLFSVRVHLRFPVFGSTFAVDSMVPRAGGRLHDLEPEREPRSENREARTMATLCDSCASESRP